MFLQDTTYQKKFHVNVMPIKINMQCALKRLLVKGRIKSIVRNIYLAYYSLLAVYFLSAISCLVHTTYFMLVTSHCFMLYYMLTKTTNFVKNSTIDAIYLNNTH